MEMLLMTWDLNSTTHRHVINESDKSPNVIAD